MTITSFHGKYRWLSNFWPCDVLYGGIVYSSSEHAYQAAKTFDANWRSAIFAAPTPGIAKKLGKDVPMRSDWESVKLRVMEDILRSKFMNIDLRKMLIDTGDQELIEGNMWGDTFWGVCRGKGDNNLGKLLMKIRNEIALNGKDNADN